MYIGTYIRSLTFSFLIMSTFNCILRNLTYTLRLFSQAMVIVWNYDEGTMMGSYETHKVGVEDLCFTCNSDFLVSLGGRDDGNVIVWGVQKNSLICGILSAKFKNFFFFFYKIDTAPCLCKSERRVYIRFGKINCFSSST